MTKKIQSHAAGPHDDPSSERKRAQQELQIKSWALESALNGIVIGDLEGRLDYVNAAFLKLWGYGSAAEVLGRSAGDLPETAILAPEVMAELRAGGSWVGELDVNTKDGRAVPVQISATLIRDVDGTPIRMMASFVDLTERRQAKEALRSSEVRFRTIVEQAPIAMAVVGMGEEIEFINQKAIRVFGFLPEDIPTMDSWWLRAYPDPSYREQVVADWTGRVRKALSEGGEIVGNEYRVTCKDGSTKTMFISGAPAAGKIFVTFDDITERRRAEELLRESEERFGKAFLTSPYAYIIARMEDGAVLEVNDAFAILSGYSREEALASTTLGLGIWVDAQDRKKMVAAIRQDGAVVQMETRLRAKTGRVRTVLFSARTIELHQGACIISIIENIDERKQAEQARRASEAAVAAEKERLAVTLRSIGDGVIATDIHGHIVLMNRVAETLTGWPLGEATGQPLAKVFQIVSELTREHLQNPVEKVLSTGKTMELANHTLLVSRDGTERVIADSGAPIKDGNDNIVGVVLVFRDVTEKQKLMDIIQRTAKLDSLGVLAGGIAHDFNNLLTGLFGHVELARLASKDEQTSEYLDATLAGVGRARALTQQLLTFAKGGAPIQRATSLVPFIQQTVQFALSGSSVAPRVSLPEGLWPCHIDKNQIGQVVDNIVINAQQAMPNGGAIEVSAANVSCAEGVHPPLDAGDYVKVSVKDFGIGIPKDVLPRIFDPFYTTKTKGHGLGLATCHSIISRHGGCIEVESQPGKGSTFHLYLPASSEAVAASAPTVVEHRGAGTILVVDDEEVVRDTVRKMCESLGYTVVCKKDGTEAINLYLSESRASRRFAAIDLDLTVRGGTGGIEVVAEIRKLDQEVPVFVVSGYADDSAMKNPRSFGFTASLPKPFTIRELSDMLSKHLVGLNGIAVAVAQVLIPTTPTPESAPLRWGPAPGWPCERAERLGERTRG